MIENSPEYDLKQTECRDWREDREGHAEDTHRSNLETELGYREPARHPLIAWLVRHSTMIVDWTVKRPDGITAYHRVRSKPFKSRLLRFGEACSYKSRAQEPLSSSGDRRWWHEGVFIGIDERTGQYMIHGEGRMDRSSCRAT